jgi:hypothetical protein
MIRISPSGHELKYPLTDSGKSLVVQSDGSVAPSSIGSLPLAATVATLQTPPFANVPYGISVVVSSKRCAYISVPIGQGDEIGTGNDWKRLVETSSPTWKLQTNWYVDESAGSDDNSGDLTHPIQHVSEIENRWGGPWQTIANALTTIYILGAITEPILLRATAKNSTCELAIIGIVSPVLTTTLATFSDTNFTDAPNRGGTEATISLTGVADLTPYQDFVLKNTTTLAWANVGKIGGRFGAGNQYCTTCTWGALSNHASHSFAPNTPTVGETIEVYGFQSVKSLEIHWEGPGRNADTAHLFIQFLSISECLRIGPQLARSAVVITNCRFESTCITDFASNNGIRYTAEASLCVARADWFQLFIQARACIFHDARPNVGGAAQDNGLFYCLSYATNTPFCFASRSGPCSAFLAYSLGYCLGAPAKFILALRDPGCVVNVQDCAGYSGVGKIATQLIGTCAIYYKGTLAPHGGFNLCGDAALGDISYNSPLLDPPIVGKNVVSLADAIDNTGSTTFNFGVWQGTAIIGAGGFYDVTLVPSLTGWTAQGYQVSLTGDTGNVLVPQAPIASQTNTGFRITGTNGATVKWSARTKIQLQAQITSYAYGQY